MTKENRLVVQSKGTGYKWEKEFFVEVQKAILEGYRIADNDKREDMSMRNFRGRFGRVVMYKEEVAAKSEKSPQTKKKTTQPKEKPTPTKKSVPSNQQEK